ncbi:MAG: glycine--tRNA ligase subunit beta [Sulfurimonas sp.]|nr:MAG: glycine--tRNA ligase subunit beta [Sulfurimonas sp.]
MVKPLLIEIGVEELPALPLLKELQNIESKWLNVLETNALVCEFEFYYTPRRLVLWHREFLLQQPDTLEELYGAPVAVAFKDGEPTKAALGFARKCGVAIDAVGRAKKGDKEVLYYQKEIVGKASVDLLESMIATWIKSLSFGKSMRWGSLRESFIRPIRWVNVMLGDHHVPLKLYDVPSAPQTFVHRMKSYDAQPLRGIHDYFETLKEGGVILYQDERRQRILKSFTALQEAQNITIETDEALLDEVIAITEYPTPLLGGFDAEFLRLPPEVIVTSMKEHQRYFPVFKEGELINQFVVVSNALGDDASKVIEGNEKVLRPRLGDALFFYDNDLKNGLSTQGLEKVVFIDGLGSLKDKIEREKIIASTLAARYLQPQQFEDLMRAMELAKADLMSEMVYEFTELQGLMGYYYAKALGEKESVALAIKEQYLPQGEASDLPSSPLSAVVALSIKLDTLLGLFSIKQVPTGSRDPFALRRAVNGIMRIAKAHRFRFDIVATLKELGANYQRIDFDLLEQFFLERIYRFYKVNPSVIKAVLASGERELLALDAKIEAVNTIVQSASFSEVFSTFKRVANITKDVDVNASLPVNSQLLSEPAEQALYEAFLRVSKQTYSTYEAQLDALFSLKPQLDTFFDTVMVNAEDIHVKTNRKALIGSIYKALLDIADIKEISV